MSKAEKNGIIVKFEIYIVTYFLPSYSVKELVAYINAQCCSVYCHIFMSLITCINYYAISAPLMTENMRFRPYSYPCFFGGTLILNG